VASLMIVFSAVFGSIVRTAQTHTHRDTDECLPATLVNVITANEQAQFYTSDNDNDYESYSSYVLRA